MLLSKHKKVIFRLCVLLKVIIISENDTHHNILTSRIAELEETLQEQTVQIG